MSVPFRLLTLHPWSRPDHTAALEWLEALGGRQAPLGGRADASVSGEIARGLDLGRDLNQRPNPLPGPTHVQLLDASMAMMVAVSAALPRLVVEGATVMVDLSEAGLGAALTPFGREVVAKFACDLEACGAGSSGFVARSERARDRLQAVGFPTLQTLVLPPGSSSRTDPATPSAWRAFLEGLAVDRPSPAAERAG